MRTLCKDVILPCNLPEKYCHVIFLFNEYFSLTFIDIEAASMYRSRVMSQALFIRTPYRPRKPFSWQRAPSSHSMLDPEAVRERCRRRRSLQSLVPFAFLSVLVLRCVMRGGARLRLRCCFFGLCIWRSVSGSSTFTSLSCIGALCSA